MKTRITTVCGLGILTSLAILPLAAWMVTPTLAAALSPASQSAPKSDIVTVPPGTPIHIRLKNSISRESSRPGDRFEAALDGPLIVDVKLLAPSRSRVVGEITRAQRDPDGSRPVLTLVLRTLVVDGVEYPIETKPLKRRGHSHSVEASGLAYGPEAWFTFILETPVRLPAIRTLGNSSAEGEL